MTILNNHFEQCFCSTQGHIGFSVPDVEKTCERFEKLGVTFVKKPNDGEVVLHTVFIFKFDFLNLASWNTINQWEDKCFCKTNVNHCCWRIRKKKVVQGITVWLQF